MVPDFEIQEMSGWRRPRLDDVRLRTLGLVSEESVDLAGRTVVRNDGEALVVHVKDEVLALPHTFVKVTLERRK